MTTPVKDEGVKRMMVGKPRDSIVQVMDQSVHACVVEEGCTSHTCILSLRLLLIGMLIDFVIVMLV